MNVPNDTPQKSAYTGKKVVLVDDEAMFLHFLSHYLQDCMGIQVVGLARNGREALTLCQELRPDLVIIDLRLPVMSGDALSAVLLKEYPALKVLIISAVYFPELMADLIRRGIHGFLTKHDGYQHLALALTAIFQNRTYFNFPEAGNGQPEKLAPLQHPLANLLSKREKEVLVEVCNGKSNKEIGEALGIEIKTVEAHRSRITKKLNISSPAQLALFASKLGLIQA